MKDVLLKLRVIRFCCRLRLKNLVDKITAPFRMVIIFIETYRDLRKIDKETEDKWERHVKRSELMRKDELALRRQLFYSLKAQLSFAFVLTYNYDESQEQPNEIEDSREKFQKNKEKLVSLLEKFSDYEEITFDEIIKSRIISWGFGMFKTQEELDSWRKSFEEYIRTLNI